MDSEQLCGRENANRVLYLSLFSEKAGDTRVENLIERRRTADSVFFPQVVVEEEEEPMHLKEEKCNLDNGVSTLLTLSLKRCRENEEEDDRTDVTRETKRINHGRPIVYSRDDDDDADDDDDDDDLLKLSIGLAVAAPSEENYGEIHDAEEAEELKCNNIDGWTIVKKLCRSDVDDSARLLIGKKQVETHILPFLNEEEIKSLFEGLDGIKLRVLDVEKGEEFGLNLKQWKTGSFVFTSNWRKDFVRRRKLVENDQIGLYFDNHDSKLCFSVLDKAPATSANSARRRQRRK